MLHAVLTDFPVTFACNVYENHPPTKKPSLGGLHFRSTPISPKQILNLVDRLSPEHRQHIPRPCSRHREKERLHHEDCQNPKCDRSDKIMNQTFKHAHVNHPDGKHRHRCSCGGLLVYSSMQRFLRHIRPVHPAKVHGFFSIH